MADKKNEKAVDLGRWLGRRQAFALVAGRCSAADAECIRKMREEGNYRALAPSWDEFCKQHLGISRAWANRLIQHLEEFGPAYFLLAQVTHVTPEEYRRISGSVRGQALLHAGEEIPIEAENAARLAAAIEELRRGADGDQNAGAEGMPAGPNGPADKVAAGVARAFEKAERAAKLAGQEYARLVELRLEGSPRMRLIAGLGQARQRLRELEEASWR